MTQSFPDVEVLTRYPQGHRTLALPFRCRGRTARCSCAPPPARSRPPFRFASIGSPPANSQLGLGACPAHVNRGDKWFITMTKSPYASTESELWRRTRPGAEANFILRLSTDEGILRLSRYLATVRRATRTSALRKRSTITSSDKTSSGSSSLIICRMRWRTDSAEWACPGSLDAIAAVKKYFISNRPRGVCMNLCAVARDTVEFVHPDRFADHLEVERP